MTVRSIGELIARARTWFPDREFFMRSEGQVRFIRISSRMQMAAAGLALGLVLVWSGTVATLALANRMSSRDAASLLRREARVESAEARLSSYRGGLSSVAGDLLRRQTFIERVTQAHLGDLPHDAKPGETVSNSAGEAARTVAKVSAAIPEAGPLARAEARQLAFVESLTRFADRRAAADATHLRHLGLDPDGMLARESRGDAQTGGGQGGPLEALSTSADGSLDPRFARLGASLARMDMLEHNMLRLPQVIPAAREVTSSGFGYRVDPFTHQGAFHPGLDFPGPTGAPIYAAAKGVVSFASVKSGYGNCIEIDHGGGLVTLYGHMSAFRSHVGERVVPGQLIGAVGSTGRSTGPHLHFEVRIDNRPVNPRPFLEAATHVSQNTRGSAAVASGLAGQTEARQAGARRAGG